MDISSNKNCEEKKSLSLAFCTYQLNSQARVFQLYLLNAKWPKIFWKTLKTLVPGGKSLTTSVKRLVTDDGETVTCPKCIADHYKFFVNVGVTLASKYS